MKQLSLFFLLLLGAEIFSSSAENLTPNPGKSGLSVSSEGTLLLEGKPFRAFGVNYFNAFARVLKDEADRSYRNGFQTLRDYQIPFARIMACGFWPVDLQLYSTNRAEYFARLDQVVASAEINRVGLVLSLFWHPATVPDIVREPCDQWGNPQSKTQQFMRTYTRELVTRYRSSHAVWGWEFGNEYNLAADLPNAAEHRPPVVPSLGTPSTRTSRDELTHAQFRTALAEFAKEVRAHDPHRIILSGNSFPRESGWHQKHEKSWKKDSPAQAEEMLLGDNPAQVNSLTVRCYEGDQSRLSWASALAAQVKKPLVVGEFGLPGPPSDLQKSQFNELLLQLEKAEVPLAALWVFDFSAQPDWNVHKDNGRAYQLEALQQANQRIKR